MELKIVGFELAKKLKEVGFNEPCINFQYTLINNSLILTANRLVTNSEIDTHSNITIPTQALAQMWFREEHGINISCDFFKLLTEEENGWFYTINEYKDKKALDDQSDCNYKTLEKALEAGLLEATELIKKKIK